MPDATLVVFARGYMIALREYVSLGWADQKLR